MIKNIKWLGHSSFKIIGKSIIYMDPWKLNNNPEKADIILITHSHYDHLSKEDIAKIQKIDTVILASADCAKELSGNIKTIKPGEQITIKNVAITAVPAYNINKSFHPKSKGWLGFIIDINGVKIYHAGDSDKTPEMEKVKADIILLPIGGTYTMTAEEAAEAANAIDPKIAVPMHYGDIVGSPDDPERFRTQYKGKTEILRKEI